VQVENTGAVGGDEVVQLYVRDVISDLPQPKKKLRDFKRIMLEPGASAIVSFELDKSDFSYWDESKNGWDIEPGEFEIQIGTSSEDIQARSIISAESD